MSGLGIDNVGIVQVPRRWAVWWETESPWGPHGGHRRVGTNQPVVVEYRGTGAGELGWVKIKPDSDPAEFFAA